jgi:hypothetical protein
MTKQSSFSLIRHPISLVAYALSLVFGAFATYNPNDWPWWPYVAAFLAVASVIGGLWLAHNKLKETKKPSVWKLPLQATLFNIMRVMAL